MSEFAITDENMKKEVAKRKNGTALGIDDIQNFWWKKFKPAQKALRKAFTDLYGGTAMISEWWPSGRTVLLPKTKNIKDEKINVQLHTSVHHIRSRRAWWRNT